MRHTFKTFFLLAISLTALFATSCDDDDWDDNYLVGRWVSVDEPGNEIYVTFYPDGTGVYAEYQNGRAANGSRFYWETEHGRIVVSYPDNSVETWRFHYQGRDDIEVLFNGYDWVPMYRYGGEYPFYEYDDGLFRGTCRWRNAAAADSLRQ